MIIYCIFLYYGLLCFLIVFLSSVVYFQILQNGRRPILQLLHPNCDLASLNLSIPSLSLKVSFEVEPIFSVFSPLTPPY